jgi:LysM repeat protein
MRRFARSRRELSACLVATLLTLTVATPAAAGGELVVQRGDTLWDLARKHGVTVAQLAAWNRIENPELIRIGQRIVLEAPVAPAAPAPTPAAPPPAPVVHVVRAGDTVWDLALRYGTSVAALVAANHLANPSFIRIGQALAIPQATPAATAPTPAQPAPAPASVTHVVRAGETLWALSARYGVSITAIVQANGLASASFIRTGQHLAIPVSAAPGPGSSAGAGMSPEMAARVVARSASRDLLLAAAREFGVPAPFVLAVAWHESGWQPGAVSYAGAVGLMQLMPGTAQWVADTMLHESPAISHPRWNARAGVRLLDFYLDRYGGNKAKTLAAYFQGLGSVESTGILVSSQPYINSILALEVMFSR